MEFSQLDKIISFELGKQIVAERVVRAEEPILRDHFPRFPVLPGVLMLEACFQAGMWLVLATDDFQAPWVTLESVRNAKYSDFVVPGQKLTVTLDVSKHEDQVTTFKAKGVVSGPDKEPNNAFAARLSLKQTALGDAYPPRAPSSLPLVAGLRATFHELTA